MLLCCLRRVEEGVWHHPLSASTCSCEADRVFPELGDCWKSSLGWFYRYVQDARLTTWVLGSELWSSWFHSKLFSSRLDVDVFKNVRRGWGCTHVCVHTGWLEVRGQLQLSTSVAFYFAFWDAISQFSARVAGQQVLWDSPELVASGYCHAYLLARSWEPNSAPYVCIASSLVWL